MRHTTLIALALAAGLAGPVAYGQCSTPEIDYIYRTSCSLTVNWVELPDANAYQLTYRETGGSWTLVMVTDTLSHTIEGLLPNTVYEIRVGASFDSCATAISTSDFVKTKKVESPTGFQADSTDRHQAWLSWSNSCDAASYRLEWHKTGVADWFMLEGITDTTVMLDSLPANSAYEAVLYAVDGGGYAASSDTLVFITAAYPAPDHPNIILIVTDDSRWDEYRINGAPDYLELPAIERLYEEGINFSIGVVPTPLCSPGRASIYTGLYASSNGCERNGETMDGEFPTIQNILHDNGYYTAFVGKYGTGLGTPDGFDNWVINLTLSYVDPPYRYNGVDTLIPGNILEVYPQLGLEFLNAAPEDQPFMLMYFHRAPHDYITPLPEHASLFAYDTMPFPSNFYKYPNNYPDYYASWQLEWHPDTLETMDLRREAYRALVGVDQGIQQLYDWLEYRGQMDETMIIYTSDNGFMEGAHLLDNKGMALHESLQVPFFLRYPPWFSGQNITDEIASVIDIPKTLLHLAGIEDTFGMQGLNLKDLADGTIHRSEFLHQQAHTDILPSIRSIRSLEYLYTWHSCEEVTEEFFDLTIDPDENNNLIYDPAYADIIDVYRNKLDSMRLLIHDTLPWYVSPCYMVTDALRDGAWLESISDTEFQVHPNPADQQVFLTLGELEEPVTVRLLDINGRICYFNTLDSDPGMVIQIPTGSLKPGMYVVELITSAESFFKQVIVSHVTGNP